ncbi:MAG: gamma-glutamylcyclotransferase family protein [Pseudomonadota bacterium]|nr:gamma-glutamylcyclotransferase family protein [Pseudomonadota bacterium]
MAADFLFVYGTLRAERDDALAKRLREEASLIGVGAMQGLLYRIDWYPGAVDSANEADLVYGDLYSLSPTSQLLKELDVYEGCGEDDPRPHEYRREKRSVRFGDRRFSAWVYLYNWSLDGKAVIPGGDFLADGDTEGAVR